MSRNQLPLALLIVLAIGVAAFSFALRYEASQPAADPVAALPSTPTPDVLLEEQDLVIVELEIDSEALPPSPLKVTAIPGKTVVFRITADKAEKLSLSNFNLSTDTIPDTEVELRVTVQQAGKATLSFGERPIAQLTVFKPVEVAPIPTG